VSPTKAVEPLMTSKKRTWPRREVDPHRTKSGEGEQGNAGATTSLSPHPSGGKDAPRFNHDAEGGTDGSRDNNSRPPTLNSSDTFGDTLKEAADASAPCGRGRSSGTRYRGDSGYPRAKDPPDKNFREDAGLDNQMGQQPGTSRGMLYVVVVVLHMSR